MRLPGKRRRGKPIRGFVDVVKVYMWTMDNGDRGRYRGQKMEMSDPWWQPRGIAVRSLMSLTIG